jgi:hypothetical protein
MSNVFSEFLMVQPKCEWESDSQIAGGIVFLVPPNSLLNCCQTGVQRYYCPSIAAHHLDIILLP